MCTKQTLFVSKGPKKQTLVLTRGKRKKGKQWGMVVCVGGYWNNGWGNICSWLLLFFFYVNYVTSRGWFFWFWCRRVDSSSFFLFFFFGFLPLFSPFFLLHFFTNFTRTSRGWNWDMDPFHPWILALDSPGKDPQSLVKKHQLGTANTRLSKLIGSAYWGWLFSGYLGGKLTRIKLKV